MSEREQPTQQTIDWERIRSLRIDHQGHKGTVTVELALSRNGGEGLRESVVGGPMTVREAVEAAYGIADRAFEP